MSIAIWANGILTVAQIVGGILAGSLALIADALHNFPTWLPLSLHLLPARSRDGRQTLR
nr:MULTISPECIES: cation transporter [Halomonas]